MYCANNHNPVLQAILFPAFPFPFPAFPFQNPALHRICGRIPNHGDWQDPEVCHEVISFFILQNWDFDQMILNDFDQMILNDFDQMILNDFDQMISNDFDQMILKGTFLLVDWKRTSWRQLPDKKEQQTKKKKKKQPTSLQSKINKKRSRKPKRRRI